MSTQSTPKIRHLTALTHHLSRLSHSMEETGHKMADLQRLLLAMQGFGGGQAAQFMAVSQIVGGHLEKEIQATGGE